MKILYIIPTYKPSSLYGGATEVASHLAESLSKNGHEVTIYTTNGNGKNNLAIKTGTAVDIDGVKVFFFKRYTGDHSHLSPGLWLKTFQHVQEFDVVHLHSWWSPSIVIAAVICKLRGVKPVLSPHGMFCDYVLNTNNRIKKKILHYFTKSTLRNTWLHVSTGMEWRESQKFIRSKWQGITIANPVKITNSQSTTNTKNRVFTIGFLSRIDPKKGIDILIRALSRVNFEYRLKIAGGGDENYINYLHQEAQKAGNAHKIDWVGWKFNKEKHAFFQELDLFALTSLNENFAVVVIESLAVGTPVLVSKEVGLADYISQKQLGWVTEIHDEELIIQLLEKAFQDSEKRKLIRSMAPEIVKNDFDSDSVIDQYTQFYGKVIKENNKLLKPKSSEVIPMVN